jgi:solute carrier family 25 S-adenosylmethionine transporter 26
MIGAIVGEASQVLVRNPFELVKQNMQLGKYKTVKEAISDIKQTKGITGLYRGYFVTVLREIPFGLIQYPLYEYCKSKFRENNINKELKMKEICKSGAIAGGISAFLTCPIDVAKTRIMTSGEKTFDFKKFIPTIKEIYKHEGAGKLFSGVHIRVFYISVGGMIFFGTNEFLKSALNFKN